MSILETDPVDWALDPVTGDLAEIEPGSGPYLVSGLAGVAQLCLVAVKTVMGELFYDLDSGVPWYANAVVPESEAVLGQRFNEERVRVALRDALLGVPTVRAITVLEVTVDQATRKLHPRWAVSSLFGDTPVAGATFSLDGAT